MSTSVGFEFEAKKVYSVQKCEALRELVRNVQLRERTRRKRVMLDLLSLTEEAAMWQKSAFAREGIGTTSGRLRISPRHIRTKRKGGVIVVTRSCLMLVVDEFVDRLLHGFRMVKVIRISRAVGHWGLGWNRSVGK